MLTISIINHITDLVFRIPIRASNTLLRVLTRMRDKIRLEKYLIHFCGNVLVLGDHSIKSKVYLLV
jgi:hypothetical protein